MAAPAHLLKLVELFERNRLALANSTQFYGDTVCGITLRTEVLERLPYLLGLLNSRLMDFYDKQTTVWFRRPSD